MLDVRVPIGWLFIVYGTLLVGWALYKPVSVELGVGFASIDLNLLWGGFMLVFGLCMKIFSSVDSRNSSQTSTSADADKSNQ